MSKCDTCVFRQNCQIKNGNLSNDCDLYAKMEIMAVPNPRAYVLKKEDIEAAKHLAVGIEDGWIDGSTNEAMEKYQEAKEALSLYDLIKTIKSDAYKEFVAKLKLHRRKMTSADFSGEFWDYAVLEESIDSTLKELEGKL